MRKLDVDIVSGHISVQSTNCLMNILYHITLYHYREMQLSFFQTNDECTVAAKSRKLFI